MVMKFKGRWTLQKARGRNVDGVRKKGDGTVTVTVTKTLSSLWQFGQPEIDQNIYQYLSRLIAQFGQPNRFCSLNVIYRSVQFKKMS